MIYYGNRRWRLTSKSLSSSPRYSASYCFISCTSHGNSDIEMCFCSKDEELCFNTGKTIPVDLREHWLKQPIRENVMPPRGNNLKMACKLHVTLNTASPGVCRPTIDVNPIHSTIVELLVASMNHLYQRRYY